MTATGDEPLSIIRQLELMRDLQRLANERAQEESRIRTALADGLREAERTLEAATRTVETQYTASRDSARAEYDHTKSTAQREYEEHRDAAQRQYKGLRSDVESEHARVLRAAIGEQKDASWEALAVFDAIKGRPRERLQEAVKQLRQNNQELAVLERDATAIMKMRRQWREFPAVAAPPLGAVRVSLGHHAEHDGDVAAHFAHVDERNAAVRNAVLALYEQRLPRFFEGGYPVGVLLALWLLAAIPCGFLFGWTNWLWAPVSAGLAIAVGAALAFWLYPRARQQSGEQFQTVRGLMADARQALEAAADAAQDRARREAQTLVSQRDQELTAVERKLYSTREEKDRWKELEMTQAGSLFPSRLAELRSSLEQISAGADHKYNTTLAKLAEARDAQTVDNQQRYEDSCRELRTVHDRDWESLAERWFNGFNSLRQSWQSMQSQCERLFPNWETTDEKTWPRPTHTPPAICFGRVALDLANVKNGIPQDERLRPPRTLAELPALMTLKEHPVMVLTAEEEGRRAAIDVLQATMLRFLTAMPPGKVRFTILDPVGLGESFASFMHLADYDELLISGHIWTESRQIEEQLTRLTAHMETVLQKYLRNQFATIDEYNEAAGEVAEPFHVLVVANFPTNFSESAARKLISIGTSGPRCGVYTLLSIDRKLRLPNEIQLHDLLASAVHLDWQAKERRFRWRYPAFEHLPLALDGPPSADRFNDVVRAAGEAAKNSMRVEVPFEVVAPAADELWKGDDSQELVVPIGRAGAMRLQSVRLGRGTAQHLLVAGKTGSGKSTFLHALVTNTALHFSPDEVEFYLIDFKKGVEFKTYATHRLPHARVIAIESEREFGLSVLERLDGELRRRGELFRTAGVQDLAGYRALIRRTDTPVRPSSDDSGRTGLSDLRAPMPRILLVIDEFQELFVEDDKLSQDAALLLDRLVRQGRAFGMHVLLGSQTLSGAYSLARSTMGQMAIRVALQCSETDAHLILSDERNSAARYLSRPGEAIYNDQNGLVAGNQPFQVVWLSDAKRADYLRQIEDFAAARGESAPPAIVFEGDQPADPAENQLLVDALDRAPVDSPAPIQRAWLGAAVAIKEPTHTTFGRHAGSNMLVVGSEDESAIGVLTNAILALAAQNPIGNETVSGARFFVLDGSRPDAPHLGIWQKLAEALPHNFTIAGPRDVGRVIGEIAAELSAREAASQEDAPPIYLVVTDAGRFRDLRRGEDDFSFSMDRDKPPRPDRQWAEILRNGPAWGVHTLVWCSSYNDVNRLVDRQTLREFEMRVVFQMSAADSTNLLDSPAASRLRMHRGLLYSDDLGTVEKFRPYAPPSDEWLARVRAAFTR